MVEIRVERTIAAPVQQVFDWVADPANFAAPPLALRVGYAKCLARAGAKLLESVSYRLLRSSYLAILDGCSKALQFGPADQLIAGRRLRRRPACRT
ncbi:MAG: SRPBCC family protein [Mycobacterium sp.]